MFESRRLSWDSQTLQEIGIGPDDELLILRAQCGGKPVIYVFSPQPLEVTVKLSLVPQWEISHIYPIIPVTSTPSGEELTWRVKTHENGSLTELNTGLDVSYLFWEAKTTGTPASLNGRVCMDMDFCPLSSKLTPNNSVLLPINSVTPYLNNVLRALGLHTEAVTSFITYWLPSLSKHAYVALRLVPQAAYEKVAPLAIIPTPDVVTRIFMLFKGIEDVSIGEWQNARERASHDITFWKDLVAVDVEATTDAKKYRVIEWGGMEVF
ncbi:hypothetical protein FISHEDRAFT_65848 [Fistulina hepatica ATCC 64428]|uniref:Ubiquitin-like domain-containing protein n=1 Tax=Fistulina hepatica ATCC 64428 TaxID=1128425 RepID=A0A0D7ABJ0_9AGAR|nr:hypothetical protein FISHEDRAFT_65848 [Fistulina hepatica ATCC 64428]